MREVLFRGKNKHGKWYYGFYTEGYYLDGTPVSWIEVVDRKKKETDSPTVIPETVGQFIGLTDKNGKKIFEGDILKGSWNTILIVFYDDISTSFRVKTQTGHEREPSYYGLEKLEVIGNIHDDPELMEVSE